MCMSVRHRKRQRKNNGDFVPLYCLLLYVRVCGRAGVRVRVRVLCVYVCVRACVHWSKASKRGEIFFCCFPVWGKIFIFIFSFAGPSPEPSISKNEEAEKKSTPRAGSTSGHEGEQDELDCSEMQVKVHPLGVRA
jgi:hypothetical protein